MRLRLPLALASLFAFWLFLAPSVARAQSIGIYQADSLPRVDASGNQVQKRPLTLNPEGVSYQDCKDDQRIRFALTLGGFAANGAVEVWAGLSGNTCADQTARTSTAHTCWRVASGIPLQLQTNVDIPVRAIMAGALDQVNPDSSEAICGRVDLTNISLNFQYYAPGNTASPATAQAINVKVDTVGPPALTGVSVLPGDTRLHVSWTAVGEGGVQDLTAVSVYCAPATDATGSTATNTVCNDATTTTTPLDATIDDSGDASDAGSITTTEDAGCTTTTSSSGGDTTCSLTAFKATSDASTSTSDAGGTSSNIIPDNTFDDRYRCGRLQGNTGAGVTADAVNGAPLVNGTRYVVAIAAEDSFGNRGQLSSAYCDMPEETNDFWKTYKSSNGQAGGGFCSATGGAGAAGSFAALGVAALAVASMARRRAVRRGTRQGGGR